MIRYRKIKAGVRAFLDVLLWCPHKNQTTPRKDGEGDYRRCLDCTRRLPWKLDGEPLAPPRLTQPKDKAVEELERLVR